MSIKTRLSNNYLDAYQHYRMWWIVVMTLGVIMLGFQYIEISEFPFHGLAEREADGRTDAEVMMQMYLQAGKGVGATLAIIGGAITFFVAGGKRGKRQGMFVGLGLVSLMLLRPGFLFFGVPLVLFAGFSVFHYLQFDSNPVASEQGTDDRTQ